MGSCTYCGKPVGFLKKSHKECKQNHKKGKTKVVSLVSKIGVEGGDLHQLEASVEQVASTSFINKKTLNALVASGWEKAVEIAFEDGLLSEQEESTLNELRKHFSLQQQVLDRNGAYSKLVKGAVLRDIMDGNLKERMKVDGNLPFNFQKSEKVIWVFQGVNYYEEKTRTRYVGGSQGVAFVLPKDFITVPARLKVSVSRHLKLFMLILVYWVLLISTFTLQGHQSVFVLLITKLLLLSRFPMVLVFRRMRIQPNPSHS